MAKKMTFDDLVRYFERQGYSPNRATVLAIEEVLAPWVTLEEAEKAAKEKREFQTVQGFRIDSRTLRTAIKKAKELQPCVVISPTIALFPAAAGAIHHAVMELYTKLMNKYGWPDAVAEAWREVKKKHRLALPSIVLLPSRASRALHSEVLETAHRIFKERTGKTAGDVLREAWAFYGYPEGPEKPPSKPKGKPWTVYFLERKQFKEIARTLKAWAKAQHKAIGSWRRILPPTKKGETSQPLPTDSALVRVKQYYYVLPHTSFKVLYDTKVREATVQPHPEGLFVDWGTGRWQFRVIKEKDIRKDLEELKVPVPTLEDILEGKEPEETGEGARKKSPEERKREKEEQAAQRLAVAALKLVFAEEGFRLYRTRSKWRSTEYDYRELYGTSDRLANLEKAFDEFQKAWNKAPREARSLAVRKLAEISFDCPGGIPNREVYRRRARRWLILARRSPVALAQEFEKCRRELMSERKTEADIVGDLESSLTYALFNWFEIPRADYLERAQEALDKIRDQPRHIRIVLHDHALKQLEWGLAKLIPLMCLSYADRQLANNRHNLEYYPRHCAIHAVIRWFTLPTRKSLPNREETDHALRAFYGFSYAANGLWRIPEIRRALTTIWEEGIRLIPDYSSIEESRDISTKDVVIPRRWIVNEVEEYEIQPSDEIRKKGKQKLRIKTPQGEVIEIEVEGSPADKVAQALQAIAHHAVGGDLKKVHEAKATKPWLTDHPFTKEDADRYNRYTHFETTAEEMNRRFREDVEKYEEWVRECLKEYGITEIPENVRRALEGYRKALYEWEIARIRAREIAPPVSVVGPAKYKGNPEKADRIQRRAREALEEAKEKLRRAVKRYDPDAPIHSDDPEAIQKLRARIERLKKQHEEMKELNKLYRQWKRDPGSVPVKYHNAFREIQAKRMKEPWREDIPYPSFYLKKSLANIRRLEKRLKELEELKATSAGEEEFSGGRIIDNAEISRVQIVFDEIPPPEVRAALKARGFRWSPKNKAWQRKRTPQALRAAREIIQAHYSKGG